MFARMALLGQFRQIDMHVLQHCAVDALMVILIFSHIEIKQVNAHHRKPHGGNSYIIYDIIIT